MGLAASQARYLGLTARKSNVEYQGQQINQQRTALSNEVNGLYEEYNNLDVPTAPSISDYQSTTYTLDSTYEDYEITNFSKITDGEYAGYYNVTLNYSSSAAQAYTYAAKDSVITAEKGDDGYTYLNIAIGTETYTYEEGNDDTNTITKITGDYEQYSGLTTIMNSQGVTDGTYYMFIKDGVCYYTSENDLDSTAFETVDDKSMYYGTYSFDYQGSRTATETATAVAALTQNSSGRISAIQILSSDAEDLVGNTYSVTTSSEDDENAYDDALNQYYYEKALYEKEVQRINNETEKLQKEDRSLELKLNQLDTEQQALATEMDSVSQVIEDTIESIFKTYSS